MRARTPQELIAQFRESYNIAQRNADTPCWEWTRGTNKFPKNYGRFMHQGKHKLAHRFAWEITHGAIPEGLQVCHKCDNPLCVRPDHLFLSTNSGNQKDSLRKGRHAWQKLIASDVLKIRELNKSGKFTKAQLATMFSVTGEHIRNILIDVHWKHLLDPTP
jgi:hypothetical protein